MYELVKAYINLIELSLTDSPYAENYRNMADQLFKIINSNNN